MSTLENTLSENISLEISPTIKSWIVCFSAALFFFYEYIQLHMFSTIDQDLMRDFGLRAGNLGNLSACYFYSCILFLLPAGQLLDRFSVRNISLIAMGICVLGTALFSQTTSLLTAEICRFFTGIGSAFCFLSCVRLASRWFPSNRMAFITGLIVTMAMIGGMVAQTPLALLTEKLGWRNALMMDAVLGAVIFAIIWTFVKDYPEEYDESQHASTLISNVGYFKSLKQSYLKLQNWLAGIYTCLTNLPIYLLGAIWGGLYLMQIHHFTRTQASYITSMIFIGSVVGCPLMGWISDYIGKRRLPMLYPCIISFLLVTIIIYAPSLSLGGFMLLFFLIGLTTSSQIISYPAIAESNSKALTATAVSVVSFTTLSGGAVFQPLFGWLMDKHWDGTVVNKVAVYSPSDYHFALMIMPIGFVIAFIAAKFLRETNCQRID